MTIKNVTPAALYERMQSGEPIELIDVRSPHEYASGHVAGARLVPLNRLSKKLVLDGRRIPAEQPIYVVCRSGARSQAACAHLMEQGMDNVVNVEGGTQAWRRAGLPVEGSRRRGANYWLKLGGLVAFVTCLVLSLTLAPAFAFVAAGVWLVLLLTGNAPCCAAGACSTDGSKPG